MTADNKEKKGIVFFDLDGTLLDNNTDSVPQSAELAIAGLRNNRYIICLSTGRDMDTHYSSRYLSAVRPDAVIHLNGNKISIGGQTVFRHLISRSLLHEIYDFCLVNSICVGTSILDRDYYICPEKKTAADLVYNRFIRRNYIAFEQLFEQNIEVSALSFAGDIAADGAKLEAHFPQLKLFPFSSSIGADIVEQGFSKADGMLKICDHYGIGTDRTAAFGDSQNDISILRAAALGIAMGNADHKTKAAADYVTDSVDHDGVYNACVRFGLI